MRKNIGLYRGKRKDGGGWVSGYLSVAFISNGVVARLGYTIKTLEAGTHDYREYEVDEETIGEYAGRSDKNGKKIFEGDIVEVSEIDGKQIAPIVFRKGCFIVDGNFGIFRIGVGAYKRRQLKVIGNIFDSPELLQERKPN